MNKIKVGFYHGTSVKSAAALFESGWWNWGANCNPTWDCSMPNFTYAWCGLDLALSECYIDRIGDYKGPSKEADERAIQFAIENGQNAAALQNSQAKQIVVLGWYEEIEVDDETLDEDEINDDLSFGRWLPDSSAPYMGGAYEIENRYLRGRKPDVIYIQNAYDPMLRGALLPVDMKNFNDFVLSENEKTIARIMRQSEEIVEMTLEMVGNPETWKKISETTLKHLIKN